MIVLVIPLRNATVSSGYGRMLTAYAAIVY
jgi:hypothetical protein